MTNSSNFLNSNRRVIKYPIITDKSTQNLQNNLSKNKCYSFVVDRYSDKPTIKAEIEYLFRVKIVKITTCHLPRKKKRVGKFIGWKPRYKKAMVSLAENDTINLFGDS